MADTIVTVNIHAKTANTDNGWVPAPVAKQSPVLNYDADLNTTLSLLNFPNVFIYDASSNQIINKDNLQTYYPEYNPGGGGGGGTSNYSDLTNKPKINNVTLQGNKSLSDIGATSADEVYKKSEVDTALNNKVTKETGKGLSTNDFTNDALTKLSGIEPDAEANVQSDWNQTDTEADDFIKNKPTLGTAASLDMDTALDGTSTNPVQNKAVQAPIARLIDAGSKNLFDLEVSTFTSRPLDTTTATKNSNGSVLVSATGSGVRVARFTVNLQSGVIYRLSGCPSGGGPDTYSLDVRDSTNAQIPNSFDIGSGSESFTVPTSGVHYLSARFADGYTTPSEGVTFYPMLCKEEDYKISPGFVQYAPSNRELYEMIGDINTVLEEVL